MLANAALTLASLAIFVQATSAATCTRKYTVKAGDYCDSISAANKVSTYQLAALNAGTINVACDNLVPGQELCLGTDAVDCKDTTVVIAGNTCSAIWSEANLDREVFYQNNPQVQRDCRNIYIDEVLCVGKTVQVPDAPNVPIHTGPPPSQATPPVPSSSVAPPVITPAPPAITPAPLVAAPTTPATGDDEECEDEYEEIEVVEGPTDEDLPFCDELE